jgi:hypothetical protein
MKKLSTALLLAFLLFVPTWVMATNINVDADSNGAMDVNRGGTNATTAAGARANLGLVIGNDVLSPTGDGSGLTGLIWFQIGSKPTTLSGFGILDAEPLDATILKAATGMGTFTGATIADGATIHEALQALETAVEATGPAPSQSKSATFKGPVSGDKAAFKAPTDITPAEFSCHTETSATTAVLDVQECISGSCGSILSAPVTCAASDTSGTVSDTYIASGSDVKFVVGSVSGTPGFLYGTMKYAAGGTPPSCADSSCSGLDPCQNFEGTGYDNSETWTESCSGGSCTEDDTTATVLRGSQQLKLLKVSGTVSASKTVSAASEFWLHFLYKSPTVDPGAYATTILRLKNGTTDLAYFYVTEDAKLSLWDGDWSHSATTTDALSDNTKYHVWVHYKNGTGANAEISIEFTADATRTPVGSGSKFAGFTNGTPTLDLNGIFLFGDRVTGGDFFDQVIGKSGATAIGTVCQ